VWKEVGFYDLWSGALPNKIIQIARVEQSLHSGVGGVEWLFWEWSAAKQAQYSK
jgi:hypothetical protein